MARANRFVSYLTAEIEPGALRTLSSFEQATEKVFQRIDAFATKGGARLNLGPVAALERSTRTASAGIATSLSGTQAAAARTSAAIREVGDSGGVAARGLTRVSQALNVVQGPLGPLSGRLGSLSGILRELSGISLAGVLGTGSAFALASIANGYQQVSNRLRPFYDTQQQANSALRDVINIARDTRQALDPVAQLYTRLSQASKDAGLGDNAAALTDTVAKAARLSGGDADTQKAGLTQFAQGFGSGTLGGDELKSIRENTFRLAKAIADGLGVPIAKLKQLGADGKLTPQVVSEALSRAAAQIDLEFSRLPKTISSSLTEAGNSLSIFVGRLDQATGVTAGAAKGISLLADNLNTIIPILGAVSARLVVPTAITATTAALDRLSKAYFAVNAAFGVYDKKTHDALKAGNATLLTPAGKDRAKALNKADDARLATLAANQAVVDANAKAEAAARHLTAVSIREQVAALRDKTNQENAAARAAALDTETTITASRERVAALRAELAAAVEARAAAQTTVASFARGATLTQANPALNEATKAHYLAQNAAGADQAALSLAGANVKAEGAARKLAIALEQEAAAAAGAAVATEGAADAANRYAAKGFAVLAAAEKQAIAQRAATAATLEAASASEAVAVAHVAEAEALAGATLAQRAYNTSLTFGARAASGLQKAGLALSGLLGGPIGIALTAGTGLLTYFATRTDEAADATERFRTKQQQLADQLGSTTDAFLKQSKQIQAYLLQMADAKVAQATVRNEAVRQQFGTSLSNIGLSGQVSRYARLAVGAQLSPEQAARQRAQDIGRDFAAGRGTAAQQSEISQLATKFPNLFRNVGLADRVLGALGGSPGRAADDNVAVTQVSQELEDARRERDKLRNARSSRPPDLNGPAPRTKTQIDADAADNASGNTKLVQARRALNKQLADLDAQYEQRKTDGKLTDDFVKQYEKERTAAISTFNAVGDGQRAATAARREGLRAMREATVEEKAALARGEKLADIQSRFSGAPSAARTAADAKRQIDSFFTTVKNGKAITLDSIKVGDRLFTQKDAQNVKDQIDANLLKPAEDAIKSSNRELEVSRLVLAGRGDEADLLRQKYDLIDRITDNEAEGASLLQKDLETLRANAAVQRTLTEETAQRNRLIDIQARGYGDVQRSVRDLIAGGPNLSSVKNFAKSLKDAYKNAVADKISVSIFGDAEQKFRDDMTRGLNSSSDKLITSGDRLITSSEKLDAAASALSQAATAQTQSATPAGAATSAIGVPSSLKDASDPNTIVVTAKKAANEATSQAAGLFKVDYDVLLRKKKSRDSQANMSIEDRFNTIGKDFGAKIFGANSPLTKATAKLGSFLSGAGYGQIGNSLLGGVGSSKTSKLGSSIGGGLATALGKKALEKGLTSISSSLGQFAGPLAGIAGGVLGGLLGGLFTKTKKASATITSVGGAATVTGNSGSYKKAASGLAGSVQSGIQSIADALGGSTGAFSVSIGQRKKKYVVDGSGSGKTKGAGVQKFDSQEEATQAAILDAIQDGAVKGIKEGALRLLKAGQDLDKQVSKAVKFNDVFRQLKQYTDPVGAAIDDLNVKFNGLIDVFNEAGASTSEFADLQKLYDLQRADAIKNATTSTVSQLQDFINGLTAGSESPLSKKTVYDNSKALVDQFRVDIASGKAVDEDKLIDALGKFQDASRALNGSRGSFFTDFADIQALAEKAKSNVQATSSTTPTSTALPASPFEKQVNTTLADQLNATRQQTAVLSQGLTQLPAALAALLKANGNSIAYLPSNLVRK